MISTGKRKFSNQDALVPHKTKKTKRPSLAKHQLNAMVKRAIGQVAEAKEVLTAFANTFNATQTYVALMNGVAEGTDYTQRVGRSVNHKYIEVDIGIYQAGATTTNIFLPGDFGFWALVYDRQPNGALATFANIFDGANGLAHRVTGINQDRFKIIAREEWAVGGNSTASMAAVSISSGAMPYHMRRYIDLSHMQGQDGKTKFMSTSNGIADIDEGAILFIAASYLSSATATTSLAANVKYRFTDI